MKKTLENIGGFILFYLVIIFGILLLNMRFAHLNSIKNIDTYDNYMAMNK